MSFAFYILMLLALLAVVGSLALGLFYMSRGRDTDKEKSQKMMQARIFLQGLAILLFILAVYTAKSS